MLVVLFALMLFAAATLSLFVHACRGARVDDHPICGDCGFDLYGLPATSNRCPECGVTFIRGKTRVGHRRRQPRTIVISAAWLIGSLALLAVGVAFAKNTVDWRVHAPVWLLRYETRGAASMGRDLAARELDKRLQGGALTDSQIRQMCDMLLEVQADQTQRWEGEFGDFIQDARAAGKVPDRDWNAYLKNIAVIRFDVPPEVKRDQPLEIRVRTADRCGTHGPFHQRIELLAEIPDLQTTEMESDVVRRGVAEPNHVSGCAETIYRPPGPGVLVGWNIKPSAFTALASGSHVITLHVDCETSDGALAHRELYAIRTQWRLVEP
jgi:hypothetical protein